MGYRSDVRAIIYGPTDDMQRFITAAKLNPEHKLVFEEFDHYMQICTFNGNTADKWSLLDLKCDDVKWYPDYPDVRAWHGLMGELYDDAEWSKLSYEFVRIGEEDGDVAWDRSDNCDYLLAITRPVAEVSVNVTQSIKGFPDETDQNSASQE